jgi:hypothetical protein
MRKTRGRATPAAMRDAIKIGDALVRSGYCSAEAVAAALERVRDGEWDAADFIIARDAKLRRRRA